ncbi:hypothetical protein M8J75_004335 [Diaphorina citri]|nr:hypothetical protein M8J75_004335 [Diaphorina citri]
MNIQRVRTLFSRAFNKQCQYICLKHRRTISIFQSHLKSVPFIKDHFDNTSNEVSKTNVYTTRSHTCGALRLSDVDKTVTLCGWLQNQRVDMFALLRDAYGQVQVIVPNHRNDLKNILNEAPLESVLQVEGTVVKRPEDQIRKDGSTGEIEVIASNITVLNKADVNIPFHIKNYNKAKEDLRLKHRYLDFRFPEMQHNLRFRSKFLMRTREFLATHRDFVEVETPTLFKRTPGGAREFVVPTHEPNKFYSLVQSPQQLKQLLMVGSVDRYFQIARCYRDESTRPDRQPEFTQLDIELSFTTRDDVMRLIEELLCYCLNIPTRTFSRISYNDAISLYGSDKPDLRYDCKIKNVDNFRSNRSETKSSGEDVYRILILPKDLDSTNKKITEYKNLAKKAFNDVKMSTVKVQDSLEWTNKLTKILPDLNVEEFRNKENLEEGDLIVVSWGKQEDVLSLLGMIRSESHKIKVKNTLPLEFDNPKSFSIFWVVDFPLFLPSDSGTLESAHHPFTQPHPEDEHLLSSNPLEVRGLHYDLVLNGNEIGGGSIRIHSSELQESILHFLNIETSSLQHMIQAFKYGCPPHGGIALGIDRLMSILCGTQSIRDVIAFPKGFGGKDHLSGAPCPR